MEFKSTMSIRVQTWSRVTEVYSSQLILKNRVLPTFATGYNLVRNVTKYGPIKRKLIAHLNICYEGFIWASSDQ